MIKKTIKIPIYDQFKITIILENNITEVINKLTKTESDICFDAVFCYKKNKCDLILGFEQDAITQGRIAHECFHAAAYILDFVGINLAEESEEAYAYLLQYLVDQVNKIIFK